MDESSQSYDSIFQINFSNFAIQNVLGAIGVSRVRATFLLIFKTLHHFCSLFSTFLKEFHVFVSAQIRREAPKWSHHDESLEKLHSSNKV